MTEGAVSEEVSVEIREDHVAVVEFNRPPHNYFDAALIEQIADAYAELDADPDCRAIVLCSAGKHFCAGANFGAKNPAEGGHLYEQAIRLFAAQTPVVAAVQGAAVGGGLGVALLLNRTFPGRRLVRTLMLLPWVVPSFVAATLFQFMLQRNAGIVNKILVDYTHLLHHRPSWLLGPNTMWAIVIPSIWRGLPLPMLFFLAGLQTIPSDLHEAAKMDGAGAWRRFRYITLPLLRPLLAIQLLIGVIYAAYQFVIPYIMLGSDPGPHADVLMTLIVRQSFDNSLFGLGAAISTLLMLAMCVWVLIWYRAFRRDFEVAPA